MTIFLVYETSNHVLYCVWSADQRESIEKGDALLLVVLVALDEHREVGDPLQNRMHTCIKNCYMPSYNDDISVMAVNAPTRKHNTPRGAALPGERTTARTAVFTGMCINLPCQKNTREVNRVGSELATRVW